MSITLPRVILMSIDTMRPNKTILAMERMMAHCRFMDAVLLTDTGKHQRLNADGIRIVHHTESDRVFPILDDNGRTTHPDYELANLIEPSRQFKEGATHVFYVENDSGIVDPKAWTDEFLRYDFIGAPWPVHSFKGWPACDGKTNAVGNFGFSLRSRKFCELVAGMAQRTDDESRYSCDAWACRTIRPELEAAGVRYAPVELARRFSCEDRVYSGQFGFHGRETMRINNWEDPMVTRDIYAFHMDIGDARLNETVPLWESIWRKHGWTPHVLGLQDAAKHPDFGLMWTKAEGFPTVNDRRFSTVNFLRWCAFARVNGAVSDYDVLPRVKFPPREFSGFFSGDMDGGPGFIVGSCSDFEKIVQFLIHYEQQPEDQHEGKPHVSDMVIQRHHREIYRHREDLVRCYGVNGWQSVPLVHFGNAYLDSKRSKREQIMETLKREGAIYE